MYNFFSKIVFFFITITLVSCDLLTTRKAEEPKAGRSSYIIATTPEQLFNNLQNSFREKIEQDYLSSFVDSSFLQIDYRFIPSSEAIVKYDILSQWDLKAEKTYFKNCASCHGAKAMGDGPAAAALNPKPANLAMMAGMHPDGDFAWKISNGRGVMPAWKGTLSETEIWELVNYIKSLKSSGNMGNMDMEGMKKHMPNMKHTNENMEHSH